MDDELTKEIKLREKMNILEPGKAVVKTNKNNFVRAGLLPDSMMSMNTETMTVGDDILKEDPVD